MSTRLTDGAARFTASSCGLTLLMVLAGCTEPGVSQADGQSEPSVARPDVLDGIQRHMSSLAGFGFNGVVLVSEAGEVELEAAFGIADVATDRPVNVETLFDIASITKPLTAALTLQAQRAGLLDLDWNLGRLLPETPADKRGITVEQLLSHTSGLPRSLGSDYEEMSDADYVDSLLALPLNSEPGEFAYSNAGYSLLASILSDVAGLSYDSLLRRWQFEPLGLERIGYRPSGVSRLDVITYRADRTVHAHPLDRPTTTPNLRGGGGILSSAASLHRWMRGLLSGHLLDPGLRQEMMTARATVRPGRDYALGWFVSETPWGDRKIWHSGGGAEGMSAELHWYPEGDVVLIVLASGVMDGVLPAADVVTELEDRLFRGGGRDLPALASGPIPPGTWQIPGGPSVRLATPQDFVHITLDDQSQTARLARFPESQAPGRALAVRERASTILDRMVDGDFTGFRESLWTDVSFEGERDFWSDALEQLTGPDRPFSGVDFFATLRDGLEQEHLGLARFGNGAQLVRIHERPSGQLYFFTTPGFELPTRFRMLPTADGGLAGYDFRFRSLLTATQMRPPRRDSTAPR